MKILIVLTYYRPHTSGLTIYAERLAKALVNRGHSVTVLTSQFEKSLPRKEILDGVNIVRVPVLFRLSKGVIMPAFGYLATKLVLEHEVIQLHLPQFDAAGVALRGRLFNKPTIITYHCDLIMPSGVVAWFANKAVLMMNELAAIFAHKIVTYTRDYAENSIYLRRYLRKISVALPPVVLPEISTEKIEEFRVEHNPENHSPVIGMAARFATEKGVEVLLKAMPKVLKEFPDVQVQFAGPYKNIIGEENYFQRLSARIEAYEKSGKWKFVGVLNPDKMSAFYPNLDVLVLPSLNSTEAFGLVQIEAMINGIPCVASNLPGVRQPVKMHDMGEIIPIGDSDALADALIRILRNPTQYKNNFNAIKMKYIPDKVAKEYENLFASITKDNFHR
ncbi:MAG: glycosyltransferase family 1 protein [Chloroflexi bacterium HGW-Chloroflexi-3]|nr:MAG: glycosyltransferase family 1 protein [Chloroflexi bacterium HGW-Chloroflexi-3]